MARIPQFKVEFIDPVDMCVITNTSNIEVTLIGSELQAHYYPFGMIDDDCFQVIIRVKE